MQGMPLSTENPMFHPHYAAIPAPAPDLRGRQHLAPTNAHDRERDKSARKRSGGKRGEEPTMIIPVDEDMRRLFQECKIGRGNAALLCEALAFATPEDLKRKEIIKVRIRSYAIGAAFVLDFDSVFHRSFRSFTQNVWRLWNSCMHRSHGRLPARSALVSASSNAAHLLTPPQLSVARTRRTSAPAHLRVPKRVRTRIATPVWSR